MVRDPVLSFAQLNVRERPMAGELEKRLHFLMESFAQQHEISARTRSEARMAAALLRSGPNIQALQHTQAVLHALSRGELQQWRGLLSLLIEDIEDGIMQPSGFQPTGIAA